MDGGSQKQSKFIHLCLFSRNLSWTYTPDEYINDNRQLEIFISTFNLSKEKLRRKITMFLYPSFNDSEDFTPY